MRTAVLALVSALTFNVAAASAQVRVTMAGGQVSISARNATVAQILSEWARVGRTKIVNGERLTGAPLTLELAGLPEMQALEILLRGASGYVIAPRVVADPSLSRFDRILIVPTSSAPRAAAPPTLPVPTFQPMRPAPPPPRDDDDVPGGAGAQRPAAPGSLAAPGSVPVNTATPMPATPVGVARPGMMMPTPPVAPVRPDPQF